MCSLHGGIARRVRSELEEIRDLIRTSLTDESYIKLKAIKQRAGDLFLPLKGCASAERAFETVGHPTPPKQSLTAIQNHLEELLKGLR